MCAYQLTTCFSSRLLANKLISTLKNQAACLTRLFRLLSSVNMHTAHIYLSWQKIGVMDNNVIPGVAAFSMH